MRFFDALFGRTRLEKPKMDELFSLVTAQVDLEIDLGWQPDTKAGLCLKPISTVEYQQVESDLKALVELTAAASNTQVQVSQDAFNYRWLVFEDPDFEDLVGVVHIAGQELQHKGYGEQLIAGIFRFKQAKSLSPAYLIYSYKRGAFYPFIPLPGKKRDNATELRVGSLLGKHLPTERDYTRWYPMWDLPV